MNFLERTNLGVTQGQLVAGAPCSAIAVMEGDLFLAHGKQLPSADKLRERMGNGARLWAMLTSAERRAMGVDVRPGEYLMPAQVIEATVDAKSGAPRWRVLAELMGLHDTGNTPPWIVDYLHGLVGNGGETYYDAKDLTQRADLVVPLRIAESVSSALRTLGDMSTTLQRTVAGALTFGIHTVMVCATYVNEVVTVYSALDSLTGELLRADLNIEPLSREVADRWCPRHHWPRGMTEEQSRATNLAEFNSPGIFYLVCFVIANVRSPHVQ